MKGIKGKIAALALGAAVTAAAVAGMAGCSKSSSSSNTIFLYPINYYGIEGKAFTSRWDGMADALRDAGWNITGDGQKDSLQFKASRTAECTMPEDTKIIFVNNQTWDTNLALTDKLIEYQPLAVVSTCNGVEFCSERIAANSPNTQNVTYASFTANYKAAFENGTLNYMASKYTSGLAPIVGAMHYSVTTGNRMLGSDGKALHCSQDYWTIDSYEKYCEMEKYDIYTGETPTIMKADLDAVIGDNEKFEAFVNNSTKTFDGVKALVEKHEAENTRDTVATTEKFKVGLLVPNSINDSVQLYINFIEGYLARVYNFETQRYSVSGTVSQDAAARQAISGNCKALISMQDDTDRAAACKEADRAGVWFSVIGTCIYGTAEWEEMANCAHYVGSIGTSLESEHQAGYDMVKKYIDIINERGKLN